MNLQDMNDLIAENKRLRAIVDELLKALIYIGAGLGDPKEVAIQAIDNYMEEE